MATTPASFFMSSTKGAGARSESAKLARNRKLGGSPCNIVKMQISRLHELRNSDVDDMQ